MDAHQVVKINRTPLAALLRRVQILVFRASGGRLGNKTFGCETLLLTVTGAKSGKPRTAPLIYLKDGANAVVVASNAGSPSHPAWFVNLTKNPEAAIQIGREVTKVRARLATGEERARLWPLLTKLYDGYEVYRSVTTREIPVVILELDPTRRSA